MTVPMNAVKHIRSSFRRYQMLALFFAIITITAALLAALSGLQVNSLRHEHAMALANTPPPEPEPDPAVAQLEQDLQTARNTLAETQRQLSAEKDNARKQLERIAGLEHQLTAATAKALERSEAPPPALEPDPAVARLEQDLQTARNTLAETQRQLSAEKDTTRRLIDRIAELERRLPATNIEALQEMATPPPAETDSESTLFSVPLPAPGPEPAETEKETQPIRTPAITPSANPDSSREPMPDAAGRSQDGAAYPTSPKLPEISD